MRNFLFTLAALLFCASANAATIPATLYGDPDSGGEYVGITDVDSFLDDAGFYLNFEYGSFNSPDQAFGVYFVNLFGEITGTLELFNTSNSIGDNANLVFDFVGQTASTMAGTVDLSLNDTIIGFFGFYLQSDGQRYYSDDYFNDSIGNIDAFGIYNVSDPFDDANVRVWGTDHGDIFGCGSTCLDIVKVSVNDVFVRPTPLFIPRTPVPEPSTLLVFAAGILGFAGRKLLALR